MLALLLLAPGGVAVAGKPIIDESYANGEVVYMIGPHLITNPNPKGVRAGGRALYRGVSDQWNPPHRYDAEKPAGIGL